MLKLIQATLWLLQRRQLSRRLVQVVVGRWIHVFQFRRPAMSMLSSVWDFISGKGLDQTLVQKVRRELFCCVCMVPLLHTYLGSEPVRVLAASDASSRGGAVGIASELTVAGREYLAYSLAGGHGRPVGILVVSLFNGIGGAFRCYDLLGSYAPWAHCLRYAPTSKPSHIKEMAADSNLRRCSIIGRNYGTTMGPRIS